jgi:DNA-binding transcriptional ArsR family regulator
MIYSIESTVRAWIVLHPQDSQDQSSLPPLKIAGDKAEEAAEFLKALAHKDRLWILCELVQKEKTVSQLEAALDLRQSSVSQHLARLRHEGFVKSRREGKQVFYAIADQRTLKIIRLLYDLFC